MKKLIGSGLLAAALAAPLHASADPTNWIEWSGKTGTLVQNGKTIDITYTGSIVGAGAYKADFFSGYNGAYLSTEVSNGPGNAGFLQMEGGANTGVHHIHFSSAVVNPYLALISLGQPGLASTFNFTGVRSIDIVSEGRGAYGDGSLDVTGGIVSGREGHGVVRLNGVFTDLYFTTPVNEYWYGATFGAAAVAAVPEPGTWGMLLAGGAVLGLMSRRRGGSEKFRVPA